MPHKWSCFFRPAREGRSVSISLIVCHDGAQLDHLWVGCFSFPKWCFPFPRCFPFPEGCFSCHLFRIHQKRFLQIYIENSRRWLVLLPSKNRGPTLVSRDFLAPRKYRNFQQFPKQTTQKNTKSWWHDPQDSGESEAFGRPIQPKRSV